MVCSLDKAHFPKTYLLFYLSALLLLQLISKVSLLSTLLYFLKHSLYIRSHKYQNRIYTVWWEIPAAFHAALFSILLDKYSNSCWQELWFTL